MVFVLVVILAACTASGSATAGEMQATVANRVLTSTAFPEGSIRCGSDLTYVGSEKFILYEVANCEIHLFVEADDKRVKRLYWIQFEAYLPGKDRTYDYSSSQLRTKIDGHDFHDDAWFMDLDQAGKRWRAGSDSEHVMKLLAKHGYHLGPDVMGVRLVRLDQTGRKELMIIYQEDLADLDLAVADLFADGKAAEQWPELAAGLRRRALAGMTMSMR